ncbi:MAG TPA: methylmalonyl-CoA mutase family protein, partial [Baekduia sp.]|nr:methylmalonyl-CoA mutase family protein [Baekduia sp.]
MRTSLTRAPGSSSSSSRSLPARSRRAAKRRTVTFIVCPTISRPAYDWRIAPDFDPSKETVAPVVGAEDPRRFTDSGIEVAPLYSDAGPRELGAPGQYPFTRGIHEEMYRKRLWTMRQYAG